MRMSPRVASLALAIQAWSAIAQAQDLVVPETPFTTSWGIVMREASAMLDDDSAIIVYQEDDVTAFQVLNTLTGAVELQPTGLAIGVGAVVAVLGPDAAVITLRAGSSTGPRQGVYYVVNPLSGAVTAGPVVFHPTVNEIGSTYRLAVADRSTVLINVIDGLVGRFVIIDPERQIVKVPLTAFEETVSETDVVALDSDHVAIVYTRYAVLDAPRQGFILIVDPHSGVVRDDRIEFAGAFSILKALRVSATQVLVAYRTAVQSGQFIVANVANHSYSVPTTFAETDPGEELWDFAVSPVLLGPHTVLFTFWRTGLGPGLLTVFSLGGQRLVDETPFNPEGPTVYVSSIASACRVLLAYQDGGDAQQGKFQVLDFSQACSPPPCPPDVTDDVDIYRSALAPFVLPFLQLQFVFVHNPTSQPIRGPLTYAVADLRNAVLGSTTGTICAESAPVPIVVFHPGADDVLSPSEVAGGFLLFAQTTSDAIAYAPRLLSGIPQR